MPHAGQTLMPLVKLGKRADDCWDWLGPKTPAGHGKKTYCGRDVFAHRWIWEILFGPIPEGLVVYATCGTKGCVNPAHLACGYIADANRNAVTTKLLPADIVEIRAAKKTATHATATILADRYGVSLSTIKEIWRGEVWGRKKPHRPPNKRNLREASNEQGQEVRRQEEPHAHGGEQADQRPPAGPRAPYQEVASPFGRARI